MINITDENFEQEVIKTDKPILVDFYADWCPPCKLLMPILEKIEKEMDGKFILAKANVDNIPLIAQKFDVNKIPHVILFKQGEVVNGFKGLMPEPTIEEWLEQELTIIGYEDYAAKNGFKLNPNKEVVKRIANGLLANEKKYGERYCPCRRVVGNKEEDKAKICPCQWHKEEIEKQGHCLCNLFFTNL
ncbi:thioredoxin [Dehalococcoidia bacterium]|nr:thioredoxin [Dehalococcoidia bacterium]